MLALYLSQRPRPEWILTWENGHGNSAFCDKGVESEHNIHSGSESALDPEPLHSAEPRAFI